MRVKALPTWPPPESPPLVWRARARLSSVVLSQEDPPPDIALGGIVYSSNVVDEGDFSRYAGYLFDPNPVWAGVEGRDEADPLVAFRAAAKRAVQRGVPALSMMDVLRSILVEEVTGE
ncbi:MAG: hypothetical protein BWY99_01369 [Synergistetes bacterium ADurb.BinA166]|nr:MAG: hypothetical protein BWY99_01369 [Synergistetes bacterium ADurb.BinA166]